ncbi:hypothetical protein CsatA_006424 [Cannabis sativa]
MILDMVSEPHLLRESDHILGCDCPASVICGSAPDHILSAPIQRVTNTMS